MLATNQKGFTLVEIIISILLISLVGLVFFPNLRRFNTEQQFRNDVLEVENNIKSAQNMYTTGIRCSAQKAMLSWASVINYGATISTSQRASCINTTGVTSTENLVGITSNNVNIQSSSCPVGTTSVELKFSKAGFNYTCAPGNQTGNSFNLQLQNKNDTSQSVSFNINPVGVITKN